MHEFSVTKSLIELCNQEAKKNGLQKVSKIKIRLGKFTGFSADAIKFYFDYLSNDTRCAHAKLIFKEVPIYIKCSNCDYKGTIEEPIFFCPKCGKEQIEIISGREFYVESLEGE